MGGWFGGSSTTTVVQQPSTTTIDPAQRAMAQNVYDQALQVEQRPYVPYTGQTVAGFDPLQYQGQNTLLGYAQSNLGNGYLDEGIQGARAAEGFKPQVVTPQNVTAGRFADVNLDPYLNPFTQDVINTTQADMERSRQIQINNDEDKALAAGAYGGDRHGVMDAETNRSFYDKLGQTLAGLHSQAFDTAANLAVGDLDRQFQANTGNADRSLNAGEFNSNMGLQRANLGLTAAQVIAGLGQQQRTNMLQNAGLIESIGAERQQQQQRVLDDQYARWKEGQMYPQEAVGWLANIVNGLPSFGGTTTGGGTTQTQSNHLSPLQKIGGVLGIAGTLGGLLAL